MEAFFTKIKPDCKIYESWVRIWIWIFFRHQLDSLIQYFNLFRKGCLMSASSNRESQMIVTQRLGLTSGDRSRISLTLTLTLRWLHIYYASLLHFKSLWLPFHPMYSTHWLRQSVPESHYTLHITQSQWHRPSQSAGPGIDQTRGSCHILTREIQTWSCR